MDICNMQKLRANIRQQFKRVAELATLSVGTRTAGKKTTQKDNQK